MTQTHHSGSPVRCCYCDKSIREGDRVIEIDHGPLFGPEPYVVLGHLFCAADEAYDWWQAEHDEWRRAI